MEYRIREALFDGAQTGDYCAHFYWDAAAVPYGGALGDAAGEIAMELVDGVAKVDQDLCVGCMVCANVCPRNLITAIDPRNTVVIACNSHAKGAVVNRNCTMGCMGCSLCKKICPEDAITIDRNLAVIDYSKCTSCGLCATVCPKKLIKKNAEDSVEVENIIKPLNGPDI